MLHTCARALHCTGLHSGLPWGSQTQVLAVHSNQPARASVRGCICTGSTCAHNGIGQGLTEVNIIAANIAASL